MDSTVRFGVIGLGNMGSAHARSLAEGKVKGGKIVAAADIDEQKRRAAKSFLPEDCAILTSGESLIDSAAVDAIIVATPHYSHPELAISALTRGINVVVEKPVGVYTSQVKALNAAAEQSTALFTVMFNQRTNGLYRKMKSIVESGGIGQIKRVNWLITDWYRSQSYYDSGSWRATWDGEGGGVLFNQCPHQIDLLQWITGMVPSRIRAFCHFGKWHDIEVEDDVTAYLEYANGATGAFITTTADAPGSNRFEISGTLGKLVAENGKVEYCKLKIDEREFNATYRGGFGSPEYERFFFDDGGENPQHVGILNNFVDALTGREPLFVDGKEGIKSVQIMDAMLLSAWLNDFVELPIDDERYFAELNMRRSMSKRKHATSIVLNTSDSYGQKV